LLYIPGYSIYVVFPPWFLLSVNAKTAAYIGKAYSFLLAMLLILETNSEPSIAWQVYKVMPFSSLQFAVLFYSKICPKSLCSRNLNSSVLSNAQSVTSTNY
jgi:hypothetical protein